MAHDQTTVRKVLDQARADGRGALTAPQARVLCEAYGIAVPQEGVARSAAEAAQAAFNSIVANARRYQADATIEGVQVQQMLTGGQEVIIGAVTDPAFGKLVAFGLGGILVEVLRTSPSVSRRRRTRRPCRCSTASPLRKSSAACAAQRGATAKRSRP